MKIGKLVHVADLSTATPVTINALREAFQLPMRVDKPVVDLENDIRWCDPWVSDGCDILERQDDVLVPVGRMHSVYDASIVVYLYNFFTMING